jgi:hypothetical protein
VHSRTQEEALTRRLEEKMRWKEVIEMRPKRKKLEFEALFIDTAPNVDLKNCTTPQAIEKEMKEAWNMPRRKSKKRVVIETEQIR